MQSTDRYREEFVDYLSEKIRNKEPENLYDPMVYILGLGGKTGEAGAGAYGGRDLWERL